MCVLNKSNTYLMYCMVTNTSAENVMLVQEYINSRVNIQNKMNIKRNIWI